jgi:hypothetical protein
MIVVAQYGMQTSGRKFPRTNCIHADIICGITLPEEFRYVKPMCCTKSWNGKTSNKSLISVREFITGEVVQI